MREGVQSSAVVGRLLLSAATPSGRFHLARLTVLAPGRAGPPAAASRAQQQQQPETTSRGL